MPYKSIQEAKDAGFPTSAEEIPLTLVQINKLASIYDALKDRSDVKTAFAVAWTTWKKIYKKEGDKWVTIAKASKEPLIIKGKIPINVINKRGWGIPDEDVQNAINSLKNAVVRICNRNGDAHSCDDISDPYSEIGRVINAKRKNDFIETEVAITDRIAKQKIEDRTWDNKWSPYGHAESLQNGWTHGLNIESLTLVQNPAWEDAGFNISASESKGITLELPLISLFANDANKGEDTKKEKGNMGEEDKKTFTPDDVDKTVKAAVDKAIKETQEKAKVDTDKAVKAALESKETITKTDADKLVKAALEEKANKEDDKKEKETYTKDELDTKIKASVEQAITQTKDDIERERLAASITDVLVNAGVIEETDREKQSENMKAGSSEVLRQMLENVTAIDMKLKETVKAAVEHGKNIQFPLTTNGGSGAYDWDPVKGVFTEAKQ